jgi:hypothetical protein
VGDFRPADAIGGLLASLSIFIGALALADKPVRLAVASVVLALIASRMTDRWDRLVTVAMALSIVWFVGGMTIAVITNNPLY